MSSRREKAKQASLNEIKTIALDILETTGNLNEVTIGAITRRMGITVPGFYRYHKNRQALIDHLLVEIYQDFLQQISQASLNPKVTDPCQKLYNAFSALRRWSLHNPALFRLFITPEAVSGVSREAQQIVEYVDKVNLIFFWLFGQAYQHSSTRLPTISESLGQCYEPQIKMYQQEFGSKVPAALIHFSLQSMALVYGLLTLQFSNRLDSLSPDPDALFHSQLTHHLQSINPNFEPQIPQEPSP